MELPERWQRSHSGLGICSFFLRDCAVRLNNHFSKAPVEHPCLQIPLCALGNASEPRAGTVLCHSGSSCATWCNPGTCSSWHAALDECDVPSSSSLSSLICHSLRKEKKKKRYCCLLKSDSLPGVQQANNGTLETDIDYLFQSCQAWVPGGTPQINHQNFLLFIHLANKGIFPYSTLLNNTVPFFKAS